MILNQTCLIAVMMMILLILQNQLFIQAKKRDEVDEKILNTRCKLMFYDNNMDPNDNTKMLNCIENIEKPGICPITKLNNHNPHNPQNPQNIECLEKCQYDYQCTSIKKCCHNENCGDWICLEPINLLNSVYLPPIPFNLTVPIRKHKGRSCDISWQLPFNRTDHKAFIVIVEGRSHIGSIYSEHKLSDWQWYDTDRIAEMKLEQISIKTVVRVKLRKGRWYQFRVAAINEYGFQGYSNLSKEFKLSDYPKIPQIINFTITTPTLLYNNSVYARANWIPQKSDIPIEKYHISWALHLKADNDSLYLNDAFVKEPIRFYEFWNLNVNSTYFIQVKAISFHGKRKLKSSKEAIFYNTTITPLLLNSNLLTMNNHNTTTSTINWDLQNHISSSSTSTSTSTLIHSGYSLRKPNNKRFQHQSQHLNVNYKFIPNRRYGILIRTFFNRESYNDKFLLEICPGTTTDCETKEYEAAKTKRGHIDFSQIKYNRYYTLRLIDNNSNKKKILWYKTILTPSCDIWRKRYIGLNIHC